MKNKKILLIAGLVLLVSCVSSNEYHKKLSQGQIGCEAKDIIVTNEEEVGISALHTWIAECRGKKYTCAMTQKTVNCTEMMAPALPTEATHN